MLCLLQRRCLLQVVVGAAVCGAVYAGLAYFKKDQDVGNSINRFGNNVENDARGTVHQACHENLAGLSIIGCLLVRSEPGFASPWSRFQI